MKRIISVCLVFGAFILGNCQQKDVSKTDINSIATLIKNNVSIDKIKPLISKEMLQATDSTGYSLLSQSIRSENIKLLHFLLEKGADPNIQNTNFLQSTPLMQCTNYNLIEAAKLLFEYGADVNIQDKQNDPAIHWSAYYGQVEMTKLFLDNGANPNLKSIHSDGVLHVALKEYRDEVVDLLMEYNIGFNSVSDEEKKVISTINSGQLKEIKNNLKAFNVNTVDASGTPLLVYAATKGQFEVVKYLVGNGANINAMNPTGHTALNRAIFLRHNEIAKFLISKNADLNLTDKRFVLPPILAAIRSGNLEIGKLLIKNKININFTDGINGMTPIMWAVAYQNVDFVKLLLTQNPDLSVVSNYDSTVFTLTKNEEILNLLNSKKEND